MPELAPVTTKTGWSSWIGNEDSTFGGFEDGPSWRAGNPHPEDDRDRGSPILAAWLGSSTSATPSETGC
jgi:hypothetical protein